MPCRAFSETGDWSLSERGAWPSMPPGSCPSSGQRRLWAGAMPPLTSQRKPARASHAQTSKAESTSKVSTCEVERKNERTNELRNERTRD